MEPSISSFGKRIGSKCLKELLSHEILPPCPCFKRSEIVCVVTVVDDHVIASPDESVVLESTEPGHVPTIVALGVC